MIIIADAGPLLLSKSPVLACLVAMLMPLTTVPAPASPPHAPAGPDHTARLLDDHLRFLPPGTGRRAGPPHTLPLSPVRVTPAANPRLAQAYGARGTPPRFLLDGHGHTAWSHTGTLDAPASAVLNDRLAALLAASCRSDRSWKNTRVMKTQ